MKNLLLLASLVALGASVTACDDDWRHNHCYGDQYCHDDFYGTPASSGSASPPPASSAPSGTVQPLLAVVDTDQTMDAVGGDGVGLFIEYGAGGHWHLWWTCDTNQTQQSCNFVVGASVASGEITNLDASQLAGGFATLSSTTQLDAQSTTTTEVSGIRFDTAPGATIKLEASMSNITDGSFLFFVQDGKVNGGYAGALSNPLSLVGSTP